MQDWNNACLGLPLVGGNEWIWRKRRNLYLLPSYESRLLALPINSRTATQKPTPVYAICASGGVFHKTSCRMQGITYPRASTVAQSLTIDWNFARISIRQESARINAFKSCYYNIPPHFTPDRASAMAVCSRKFTINFLSNNAYMLYNISISNNSFI